MGLIILIILILLLCGAAPAWPHSQEWGYRPFGGLGLILLILIILIALGVIPLRVHGQQKPDTQLRSLSK